MPSKNYALEAGGPERVEVTWEGAFKNVSVAFDSRALGSFATAQELQRPQPLPLPDGSRLEIVLAKVGPFPELRSVNPSVVSSLCFAKMFPQIKRRLRRDWGRRLP